MPSDDRRPVAGAVFSKREAILLAAAAMTVAATLTVLLSRLTLDDAYITFRYARHLAEGYGLGAWNHTGEHVEGYSSLLWTLLLAGAARLGVDVRLASKVLGAAAALVVIAVLFRRRDDRPAFLAGRLPRGVCAVRAVRRVGHGGRGVHQPRHACAGRSSRVAADRRAAPRRDAARGRARRGYRRAGARLAARAPAMDRRDGDCRRPDACGDRDSPLGDVSRARAQHLLREGRGRRHRTREARPGVRRRLDARARGGGRLSGDWCRRREARRRSPWIDVPRALRRVHRLYGERGRRPADRIPRLAPIRPRGPGLGARGDDRSHQRRAPSSMGAGRCRRRTGACGQRRRRCSCRDAAVRDRATRTMSRGSRHWRRPRRRSPAATEARSRSSWTLSISTRLD